MRIILLGLLVLLTGQVAGVAAQVEDPIFRLGQDESLLHISATESREVEQDLLVATLRIESEDDTSHAVQNVVNRAMADALKRAKRYPDVKTIARGYRVHSYDKNAGRKNISRHVVWKAQQTLELKSENAEDLLDLAGKIQAAGFVMGGLSYVLSPKKAAEVQDEMLEAALQKLSARALRAARALGKSKAELKEINAQGNSAPRVRQYGRDMPMMAMMGKAMATPVASAGETTVTMTVSAKALLR